MPRISQFYGIVITMNYADHNPPHFHARYAESEAAFSISPVALLAGSMPRRAVGMVRRWAVEHQSELLENWEFARRDQPLKPIPGLE